MSQPRSSDQTLPHSQSRGESRTPSAKPMSPAAIEVSSRRQRQIAMGRNFISNECSPTPKEDMKIKRGLHSHRLIPKESIANK
jgi:hypothetical protein